MDLPGDRSQPLGAVVARIHRCHDSQQHLGGADVGGGFVPADVLLARLQRQAVRRRPVSVHRHPDQATRQLPGMGGVRSQIARVWATESHWHTEPLRAAERHVGADLARGRDQGHGQQVSADRHQRAAFMGLLDEFRPVGDTTAGAGQLHDHTEELAVGQSAPQIGGDDLDPQRFGAGRQHGGGLDEQVGIDGESIARSAPGPVHQRHRFCGRGRLVEHGRIGDVQAGEVGHHRLEVQHRLEAALADLGLVRRVRGVPGGVLEDVPQQHRRGECVVVTLADHRDRDGVRVSEFAKFGQGLVLTCRCWQCFQTGSNAVGHRVEDSGRECLGGEFVQGCDPDHTQHVGDCRRIQADVA